MTPRQRIASGLLALSATGLIGLAGYENYAPMAVPPVPGDVPTAGFGATRDEAGQPFARGASVTPRRALVLLARDASEAERTVRRCAPVPMFQYEFDAYASLAYNTGPGAKGIKDGFCVLKDGRPSTLVRKLLALDYAGACAAILSWDKFQGRPLRGLTLRRQSEYRMCVGEAS